MATCFGCKQPKHVAMNVK